MIQSFSMRIQLQICLIVWLFAASAHAQAVAHVSQVLPFASKGAVSSLGKGEAAVVPPSGSTTETSIAAAGTAKVAAEGGTVVTGAGSASSLLLGSTGTARMGEDSAVQVPEATEKNHSLELLKGRLFMNINGEELKKRDASEFRLKTPAALLAVKGTRFFTVSQEDGDIIGVHEGRVSVTEPTSGKSLDLEAGKAVSVSPGKLGETREMTDEEKGYAPEYAAADLVRTPIPIAIKSPVPNTKKLQILLYQNGAVSVVGEDSADRVHYGTRLDAKIGPYFDWRVLKAGRNSIPVSPQLTADGVVHYVWTAKEAAATYQCYFDFGGYSRTNYSEDSYSRLNKINPPPMSKSTAGAPVAIQFRVRSKNISTAAFAVINGEKAKAWSALSHEGEWVEAWLLPQLVPAMAGNPASLEFPYSHLLLGGGFRQGAPAAAKIIALDLADFILLSLPQ